MGPTMTVASPTPLQRTADKVSAMATCTRCGKRKPAWAFRRDADKLNGLSSWCEECHKRSTQSWRERNRKRTRAEARLRRYGADPRAVETAFELQEGRCAICGEPALTVDELEVDHNHETGELRGLLCSDCNRGLGSFRDSRGALQRANGYLVGREPVFRRVRSVLNAANDGLPPVRRKRKSRVRGAQPPRDHPSLF